jgi:hypothetical protein
MRKTLIGREAPWCPLTPGVHHEPVTTESALKFNHPPVTLFSLAPVCTNGCFPLLLAMAHT